MTRPPPRPTLFPYTTLFRSERRGAHVEHQPFAHHAQVGSLVGEDAAFGKLDTRHFHPRQANLPAHRSEEHTSELQSQSNLVCRLLLEKKNDSRHSRSQAPCY